MRRPSKNKTKIVSDDLSFLFFDYRVGKTYEYVLEIADRPSRLGFPEGTLTSVCVYEHETIKLNTDHYFIEQYNRQLITKITANFLVFLITAHNIFLDLNI